MSEQKFVYVDTNYLKDLEEKAKKVDYYKGIIDGINMVADRKTEPQTRTDEDGRVWEYRNGNWWALGKTEPLDKDINVRSKTEPQTERRE